MKKTPDFLGYVYCPVRDLFRDTIRQQVADYPDSQQRAGYDVQIPNGHKGEDYWKELWRSTRAAQLPEVIVSAGFGNFFQPAFMERFMAGDCFQTAALPPAHPAFAEAGLEDPLGAYGVYGLFPLVLLVDKRRLGDRPVPRRWLDLLDPCYENDIIVGATQDRVHEDLLLYLQKWQGDEAVRALARNVKGGMHGAAMAKLAGTASPQGAAIYVISWIFGRCCPRREQVELIWPDEGAIVTPLIALRRHDVSPLGEHLYQAVMGPAYGRHTAQNFMPSRCADINNRLPEGARFHWLGWDYLRQHDIPALMEQTHSLFRQHTGAHFAIG